jgi:phosphoribosylaminoimidazole-succinocarboxamide synthase
MIKENILLQTYFPGVKLLRRGKVRDVYDLGDMLLVVATDRISCFDVVLGCAIPEKGKVLTRISLFWFDLPNIRRSWRNAPMF